MLRPYPIVLVLLLSSALSDDTSNGDILEFTATRYQLCLDIENFDITNSERQSVLDSIYSDRKEELSSQIEKWINNSYVISSDEYFIDLQYYTLPWLILAIATIFLSIIYLWITILPSSMMNWLKSHGEDEFILNAKRFHNFGIVTIVVLNFILIIVSIIALVYSNKALNGLDYSSCYMASSFDDLLGRKDEVFTGYSILQADFNSLTTTFADFQTELKKLYQSRVSLTLQSQQQDVIEFNDQLKRNEPNSPLPILISSNGTNTVAAKESYFSKMKIIDYMLSTKEDDEYLTYLKRKTECNWQAKWTRSRNIMGISFRDLALRDSKLALLFTKAQQQLSYIDNSLLNYATLFTDFHQTLGDDINKYVDSIIGLLIVLIIFAFIQIILWLGHLINKNLKIKRVIDILWFLCNLILIGILIVNIFLQSNSYLSKELCIYFDGLINNVEFYSHQQIIEFSEAKTALHSCLYGDGNIYNQLNLNSRFKDIRTYINSENGLLEEIQRLNSNQALYLQKLNNNSLTITSILDGTFIDLNQDESDGLNKIIQEFNSHKDKENCAELQSSLCTDGTYPKRNGNFNDSQMCWHPSYLITKYTSSCLDQQDLFYKLKLHFQSQAQGWIRTQLLESQFVSQNLDLNLKLNQYIKNHTTFIELEQKTLSNLYSLLKGANCTFMKDDLNKMLDGMCVVYSYYLNKVSVLTIVIASLLFLSVLFNCFTSIKISQMETYEEYASTKVINFAGSSMFRASIEINQIMQNESPMHITSTQLEFK
ncbi:unnamed protein product (macronuclear) [Paramecium tetraurelia]|uniref:Uncharacterized protein n=1 Tax=Paramecium tetraurelia TaxID=5888 RepID=A0C292_PARTE|nr:uncharacterized protein GSPATT00034386001 [Paramecium tetraurelia]CAK64909.1 unnamed protein product [Paramecium tetraurelia]|eukprot:XP_001432306.1 hypothetical protein (macronuclear) [Paramecium tetraurelia strain d4-2]